MNKKILHVPFHKPHITEEDISGVVDSLKSGWLTTGPKCKKFEEAFAEYIGCKHAVAVNSGTAAMHLALESIGLKEKDIVITSTMTFAATAEVVRYFNARPVFIDIEPDSLNMDVKKAEEVIRKLKNDGERVKAIMPVHFAGQACEMDHIKKIASDYDLNIVEDAAHAIPSRYKNQMIGTIGDITCFSFYATKNITTGEGGIAVTDNPEWAERMRIMSLHGISKDAWNRYTAEGNWYYEIIAPGYKYNMTDLAAALGMSQLKKVDFFQQRREEIAASYTNAFKELPQITVPTIKDDIQHSWHLYIIRLDFNQLKIDRNQFIDELKQKGIGTSVHFIPLHIHPYYRETYGYKPEDFPIAYNVFKRIISLPIYPIMTPEDVEKVIECVKSVIDMNSMK